jgi:hypothetical protein
LQRRFHFRQIIAADVCAELPEQALLQTPLTIQGQGLTPDAAALVEQAFLFTIVPHACEPLFVDGLPQLF